MSIDDPDGQRLLTFCSRLPGVPADAAKVEEEARFAIACLATRRRAVEAELIAADSTSPNVCLLRCELEALSSACSVVSKIVQRRIGIALPES